MTSENIVTRKALPCDIPQIVELVRQVADECDDMEKFNEAHAWEHMTGIVCSGVSFLAEIDQTVIGVIMCGCVDLAYTQTRHLETQHLYVSPQARKSLAAISLLKAAEDYADGNGLVILFHQMDYQSAIYGRKNNSSRVERLYKSRKYEGPVDTGTVGRERRRVGISYRYTGKTSRFTAFRLAAKQWITSAFELFSDMK